MFILGAKVIGKVCVEYGARLGANVVVTQDIPRNATVVMSEPRIIMHEKRDNSFWVYKL